MYNMNVKEIIIKKEKIMSDKKYKLNAQDIKKMIDIDLGCLATDRITVEGCLIGWMYREKPSQSFPDTGWRFFSGDETEEYLSDSQNIGIYKINTICNYDAKIIPYLDLPYDTKLYRKEDGTFSEEIVL